MARVEITSKQSLDAWLNTRPHFYAEVISMRASARLFPFWGRAMGEEWATKRSISALPLLRLLLKLWVSCGDKNLDLRGGIEIAKSSLSLLTTSLTAKNSALNVDSMQSARRLFHAALGEVVPYPDKSVAAWSAITNDVRSVEDGNIPVFLPLWQSQVTPTKFTSADFETRAIWAKDPDTWDFWVRWWDGVIAGKPLPIDLQRDVALIEDAVWQQGPKAVAEAIAAIELRRAILLTPNAEEVLRDEAGLFYVLPLTTIKPNLFKSAVEKVKDDIGEIRSKPKLANALSFLTDDFQRLEDHFDRYRDQPLRIHDVFQKTMRHLDAMRDEGLLPDDVLLRDFYQDLDTGSLDIRRADTEVAMAVKARVADRMARMKAEDKARANTALLAAANEARAELKSEIEDDLAVTNNSKSEAADKDESSNRLVSRGLRMAKRRKDDLVKGADDLGKVVKGAEAADKIIDTAPTWWEFIQANFPSFFS